MLVSDEPVRRVRWVLKKLYSDKVNETDHFMDKFVHKVEGAFRALTRPITWQSYYRHDFPLIVKTSEAVQEVARGKGDISDMKIHIANIPDVRLNKSQVRALPLTDQPATLVDLLSFRVYTPRVHTHKEVQS